MKDELREIIESKLKLVEAKTGNILAGVEFPFVRADWLNHNRRLYPEGVVEKEIKRKNEEIKKAGVAGQLNHPNINSTELDKISHVITSVEYDKEAKLGKAKALILNTTKGKDLMTLIDSKISFGASMRGFGTVNKMGVVNDDWKLATIDLVEKPSFGADTMITKANLIESGNEILAGKKITDEELRQQYEDVVYSGYRGTFEGYKKLLENQPQLTEDEEKDLRRRYNKACDAGYLGEFNEFVKLVKK